MMNNPITQADIAEALNKLGNSFDGLRQDIIGSNTTVQSIDKRLIAVENKLDGIDTRLSNVESSVQKIPDLSEKIGELKNWKQIGIIVITALVSSVFTGTIGGFIGWFIRGLKT